MNELESQKWDFKSKMVLLLERITENHDNQAIME